MILYCALLIFVIFFTSALGASLPSDFKICKRGEGTELNICLKSAVQDVLPKLKNGIPTLKIAPAEPLTIPSATIGDSNGPVHIEQNYKNFKLYGLTQSIIDDIDTSITPTAFKLDIRGHSPEYRFESNYSFNGQLLFFPIIGDGECSVILKNTKTHMVVSGEIEENKGKEYLKVTDTKLTLNPEKIIYKFDNLFNGDELLGSQTNALLNDNWKEVFEEVKPGWEQLVGTIYKNHINTIFSQVPLDDLFPK